jgi:hypothetical protein
MIDGLSNFLINYIMISLKHFIIILATRRKNYSTLGVGIHCLSNKECSITSLGVLGSWDPFGFTFTVSKYLI